MSHKSSDVSLKSFDRIVLKRTAPPVISRLYGIEPIGVGTPVVESLTSYIIRVAAAHCVTVGALVFAEIAPLINKGYLIQRKSGTISTQFVRTAGAMNSVGITATDWVTAMQFLTLRQELRFLTMMDWSALFARTHVRKGRAWCAHCYEDWQQKGTPVYDPLMWSLRLVTACPMHERLLRDKCIHCNQRPPELPRNIQPGYCPNCGIWLGVSLDDTLAEDEKLSDDQMKWQLWVAKHLGTLFTALPQLACPPKKEMIADLVSLCVQRLAKGNLNALVSRFNSFAYKTVKLWGQGNARPQLARLMELCYLAEVPLSDILIGKLDITSLIQQRVSIRDKNFWYVSVDELRRMEVAIHVMLREYPPPSMNEASQRLGCHYLTFENYFPTLHHKIKDRYSAYKAERFDRERALSTLLSAIDESPPPSLDSIAKRLGCSPSFLRLHFRDTCRIITARYAEFRKAFADPAASLIKLRALQAEFPPKSIIQCAQELGCTRRVLNIYFPGVSRAIGIKYNNYYQRKVRQRRKRRQKRIRAAAIAVNAEHLPLTVYYVRKRLPRMRGLTNREIDVVLQEMRSEL